MRQIALFSLLLVLQQAHSFSSMPRSITPSKNILNLVQPPTPEDAELTQRPSRFAGFTDMVPNSINKSNKNEIVKQVVAVAILYLTIQLRFQEFLATIKTSKPDSTSFDGPLEELAAEDVVVGTEELNVGDSLKIIPKCFYNGLELNILDNSYVLQYMNDATFLADVGMVCRSDVISNLVRGMKIHGRRRAFLSDQAVFRNNPKPSIVHKGSMVLIDIQLERNTE